MNARTIEYLRPSILDRLPAAGHAIIEASAGTGKTYAIEHLILELLRTTARTIEEILVVTFTDKATAELRARIRAAIERISCTRRRTLVIHRSPDMPGPLSMSPLVCASSMRSRHLRACTDLHYPRVLQPSTDGLRVS
jgi:hypothetical protein